ncbi:MAG: heavy-metal-associated domain-containing protein [Capsulimonadales bacterium]|nr:heavy-metal-associated domain-containing protein [Capsulimonadales bacterium]
MTTTFSAPDIECDGCARAIRTALGRVDGVQEVTVDVEAKTVTVRYETTTDAVREALDRAGFPAEPLT